MNDSGNSTHRARAINPADFRAQATGVGMSLGASRRTGAARAMEVVEHMPPAQRRAVPAAEGYPTSNAMGEPYEGMAEGVAMGDDDDTLMLPTIRSTLR